MVLWYVMVPTVDRVHVKLLRIYILDIRFWCPFYSRRVISTASFSKMCYMCDELRHVAKEYLTITHRRRQAWQHQAHIP